ncbi:hypothetical protein MMC14_003655 [Varicellaria rhodocarpa]|nr:hypothetical protein [Varicellaria rhodocarpa]
MSEIVMTFPPVSYTGWATTIMSSLTILQMLFFTYNPSPFMKQYHIPSTQAAKTIAFAIGSTNAYYLMGALQENTTVYTISMALKVIAVPLFWSFGPVWKSMVGVEVVTLALLAGCSMLDGRIG